MGHETMPEENGRSNVLTGETLCTLNSRQQWELVEQVGRTLKKMTYEMIGYHPKLWS